MILNEIKIFQLLKGNYIRLFSTSKFFISRKAIIKKSKIYIYPGASLHIGENCKIENAEIFVEKGCSFYLDDYSILGSKNQKTYIVINSGSVSIGDHSKISLKRIWIRFRGKLEIGRFTNINEGSEIRCDEFIKIGSYNMISYNVKIWDTNTHSILRINERRKTTMKRFPYFGFEDMKPKTDSVEIGDDCWIGENATIMKGTNIGNESIIGYGTFISGKKIPPRSRVLNEIKLRIDSL